MANEHAERKERNNEEAAISARKEAEKRAAMGADWRPDGGYLPQSHADATALLAVDSEHAAVLVAKERFKHKAEEVRISCQYDIGRKPGTLGPYTTYPRNPNGCAAGSVWLEGRNGELYNDGSNLLHRTNEWEASVWRKTNGTHKSWFEDVYQLPPGHYGPESRRQVPAFPLLPPLLGAHSLPPHCIALTMVRRCHRSKRERGCRTRWAHRRRARRDTEGPGASGRLVRGPTTSTRKIPYRRGLGRT